MKLLSKSKLLSKKYLKSIIRFDDDLHVILQDKTTHQHEKLSSRPTHPGDQLGPLVVVGPQSMQAQLLCQHLGAQAPQHWSAVDFERLSRTSVVIVDGSLGTDHPGIGLFISSLHHEYIGVVIAFCEDRVIAQAQWIEFGAQGFVGPSASLDDLGEVIRRVRSGETVLGVSVREALLSELRNARQTKIRQTSLFDSLTKREAGVLRELANGISPEEVAKINYVSLNTIRTQIRGILSKLSTGSVVGAVAVAYQSGWITQQGDARRGN